MLQSKTRWLLPQKSCQEAESLAKELQLPPIMARILIHRGHGSAEQARSFLNPSAEQLESPFVLEGIEESVQKMKAAIEHKVPFLLVHADETDAICGTGLMIHTIRQSKGLIYDSISIDSEKMQDLLQSAENKAPVIILCLGLTPMQLRAVTGLEFVYIHPDLANGDFAVSGLALRLAEGLMKEMPRNLLDLAAIGTIAANVPLLGENRAIVKLGLERLSKTKNPGLKCLKQIGQVTHAISTDSIQEFILPRLALSKTALSLLTEEDEDEACRMAGLLEEEFQKAPSCMNDPFFAEEGTRIDALVHIEEIDAKAVEQLNQLAPFGKGNETPLFIMKNVELSGMRTFGMDQRHFKCICRQGENEMEATGLDLGYLTPFISKQAKADIVGELVIHEWNGIRKPHFWIRDLSIGHAQIFDFRGTREKVKKLSQWADARSLTIYFREESRGELAMLPPHVNLTCLRADQWDSGQEKPISNLFLYDMPYSLDQLQELMGKIQSPERIYCLFGAEYDNRLASIPSREQFKWLYGCLLQRKQLRKEHIPKLAKAKGVSEHAVSFMLDVFQDLGFTKLTDEGSITLNIAPKRTDLAQSAIYQRKREELAMETEILYSSYEVLCRALNKVTITYS